MPRRPIPFRVRIALAAFAGLLTAWLIPKGGGVPTPGPSVTPSDRPGVTAVQVPLAEIPIGVSYRLLDGVRVFLVRDEGAVAGLHGRHTGPGDGPVFWCGRNAWFETIDGSSVYRSDGGVLRGAPRELERVRVLVTRDIATVFPHDITPGPPAEAGPTNGAPGRGPLPCAAGERLG